MEQQTICNQEKHERDIEVNNQIWAINNSYVSFHKEKHSDVVFNCFIFVYCLTIFVSLFKWLECKTAKSWRFQIVGYSFYKDFIIFEKIRVKHSNVPQGFVLYMSDISN